MRPISNLMKNTYSNVSMSKKTNSADVREIRRMLSGSAQTQNSNAKPVAQNSIVSSMFSYSESLKAQREKIKDANLKLKKLKYQFKDMSSKILRSKTSTSARQVASQAKREVLRLKREKQSGLYEDEEIDAAISHAKAMERVAKKKVRHLEEEEMAKAAGGPCTGEMIEEEKKKDAADELTDDDYSDEDSEEYDEAAAESGAYDSVVNGSAAYDNGAYDTASFSRDYEILSRQDFAEMMDFQGEIIEDISALTDKLFDEYAEEMQAMLEDMGLGELAESASAAKGDMDPADMKMMKIKHRNKEMKDIVQADSEYLKAVFDHLAKLKSSGSIPGMPSASGGAAPMPSQMAAPMYASPAPMPEPTINITL